MLYLGKTSEQMKQGSKESSIRYYKLLTKCFIAHPTFEASCVMSDMADILVKSFGLTWNEVEQIELSCY